MNKKIKIYALLFLQVNFFSFSFEPKDFVVQPIFSFREFNDSVEITISFNNRTNGDITIKTKKPYLDYWETTETYIAGSKFV
ncbi:MAG: hypothetical protein ACK42G_04690, partial [Candidatus Kapaibacteriota bacterium]